MNDMQRKYKQIAGHDFLVGQITTHKRMISVLEDVKKYEPLKAFDGKVINKRINDCFSQLLLVLRVEVHVQYLTFKYYQHKPDTYILEFSVIKANGERHPYRMECDCTVYNIDIVDHKRFSHSSFISAIDIKLKDLNDELLQLEDELENLDTIIEEYEKIEDSIKTFNNRYSYYLKQDFKFQ